RATIAVVEGRDVAIPRCVADVRSNSLHRAQVHLGAHETEPVRRDDQLYWTCSRRQCAEQSYGVRCARRAGDGDDDRALGHPAPRIEINHGVRWSKRSVRTQTKNAMLITPFIMKKAASRREKSSARTSECS